MSKIDSFFSKKSDDWRTPDYIYSQAIKKGMFDPCPFKENLINGLEIEWEKTNFVNPPYSKLKLWIEKSILEHSKGKEVILLIPARTDTKAFKILFDYGCEITFIIGRLRFNDSNTAPFPSMLVKLTAKKTICQIIYKEDIKL